MKLTIIETGKVPENLRPKFDNYPAMFRDLFEASGLEFTHEVVSACDGEEMPDPAGLEGIAITGSPAGVYEDHAWLDPLRGFIRGAYAARTPMLGICFGHQIIADALGGQVRKSEKGWGLGRHTYRVMHRPDFMADAPETLAIACSHQDQVIVPPADADVVLATDFTPNAALHYRSGRALSFQGHPEFSHDFILALTEARRERVGDAVVDLALRSLETPSASALVGNYIARFFQQAKSGPV